MRTWSDRILEPGLAQPSESTAAADSEDPGMPDRFANMFVSDVTHTFSPELQQVFIDAGSVTYPFLSDIDAASMQALEILNEEYEPGDENYGLPYPGIFVLNPAHEIVGKIFVERYQIRVDGETALAYALEVLDAQ